MPLDAIQNLMSEEAVPLLGPIVGEEYQEAVRICLSEELLDTERLKVEEIFSKQVLGRLEKCHVQNHWCQILDCLNDYDT
jgi:hypothetical protein